MQTNLNVATVRGLYEGLASSPAAFVSELGEVTCRLMSSDIWFGCTDEVLFPLSSDGYIVLPRHFVAVLGYDLNNVPRPVWSQFHQFVEMGIGWQDVSKMCTFGLIADRSVPSQKPIVGTATLRVKITNVLDAGKIIRLFGKDENGQTIYSAGAALATEGVNLTTVNPSVTTSQQFTVLEGVQAPLNMLGYWTLWQVVNGIESQIGSYQPGETIPLYPQFKIGIRTDQDVVRCYCRRQWVPPVAETDFVYPGCLPAIKMGFKALQLENANKYGGANEPNADNQWERAIAELDKDLAVRRGSELPSLRMISGPYPQFSPIVN